jgi:ATP-dependent DNA ligase
VIAGAFDIPVERAILDGEIVVLKDGRTTFSELQAELGKGNQDSLNAFDLLYLEGFDLRKAPLMSESASSRCSSTKPAWRAQLSTASICGRTATRCLPTHANGKALVYSGKVGTGWSRTVSGQIRKKLDPVVIHTSKLTNPIRDPNAT